MQVLPIQDPKTFVSELGAHLKSALKEPVLPRLRATGEKARGLPHLPYWPGYSTFSQLADLGQ